jgi:plasmanylethanolamine desaturase
MGASNLESKPMRQFQAHRGQDSTTTRKVKRVVSQAEEAEHLAAGRTSAHVLLEFCGVVLFLGWAATTAKSVYDRFMDDGASPITTYRMVVAVVLGMMAADLTSGVVHWAVDNWGESNFPVLGSVFFRPFHHHHADPHAITTHGFIETNGNNFFSSLPLLWAAASAITYPDAASSLAFASFWLSYALCSGFANQIHSWAHMKNPPKLVRDLQDFGLLVSRRHHQVHHIRPHDCNYCLVTGWMNRPLTAIGFFEAIERMITKLTGSVPLHARI